MAHEFVELMMNAANNRIIVAILLASVVDILIGLVKAGIGRNFNSTISTAGILKHVAMVVVPVLVYPLFQFIPTGGPQYWTAFSGLILVTIVLSIAENWAACGLPFPEGLKKYLDDHKTALVKPQEKPQDVDNETNKK